ncbi:YHS domain-containing protein [Microbaculum sp. FT89]|uniref:YHS domain-containing protein n=1 Tax=Microbaculum sp. FT89 TaxID=3447298 RepID=UPI003F52B4EB
MGQPCHGSRTTRRTRQGRNRKCGQNPLGSARTDVGPVRGKTVRTDEANSSVYDGTVYYFCSRGCRSRFEAAPSICAGSKRETLLKQKDYAHGRAPAYH